MIEQQQPQTQQRCHVEGIGFGTITAINIREASGLRVKATTILTIQFDAGPILKKKLTEVELLDHPDDNLAAEANATEALSSAGTFKTPL